MSRQMLSFFNIFCDISCDDDLSNFGEKTYWGTIDQAVVGGVSLKLLDVRLFNITYDFLHPYCIKLNQLEVC